MIDSLIHRTARGEKTKRVPFWFMRQAGRYLPEYRELRAKAGSFLDLCYNPEWAAEVTLQPIRRFDMDAAIVFSDILVIPHAMGVDLRFEQGEGPKLSPVRTREAIDGLSLNIIPRLQTIGDTLAITRKALARDKSLIGFCGAPWTVACYMVEGHGRSDFASVRAFAREHPDWFAILIDKIITASARYLHLQVESGADTVQIFDSWAGILPAPEYDRWVTEPNRTLVALFKQKHPQVPVIGFARASGEKLKGYSAKSGIDVVGIDNETALDWALENVHQPLQGNLDPQLFASDKDAAVAQTRKILQAWKSKPFIFNLGHGIVPATPLENVQAVCDTIREGTS